MHLLNLYIVVFLCFSICALVHSFYFVSDLFHLFSCQSLHLWICALLHLCINAFHHLCPFSGCSPLCSPTLAASTSHRGRACCQPAQAAPAFPPSHPSVFSEHYLHYFCHISIIISLFLSINICIIETLRQLKRSCTTLPPSINTSIKRFNHHYLCDVPFNMYLLGVQIFHHYFHVSLHR